MDCIRVYETFSHIYVVGSDKSRRDRRLCGPPASAADASGLRWVK